MEILEGVELVDCWPIKSFRDAYEDLAKRNITRCFAIAKGDGSDDPDGTSLVFVRLFVENGERAKKDQKYIVGLRFYSFGDMATIDIISLDKPNHRDIVKEHAKRMNWLLPGLTGIDAFQEAYSMPIFAVGAHLRIASETELIPFDNSGDFGNRLLGLDVNEVVKQVSSLCDLSKEKSEQGESMLEGVLEFMLQNKKKQDFYELLVEHYISGKPTGQNFGSLLTMKVFDRSFEEGNDDFMKLLVEELTDGFAKRCVLIGAVHRMEK
ncbi:MAG: hypothetical protein Q8L10_03720 [Candidatus Moranbacteria bacterium]|nr:hypothetical protein [Candidatus Moranbacteria bacterium]